jgi:hypothetical protein
MGSSSDGCQSFSPSIFFLQVASLPPSNVEHHKAVQLHIKKIHRCCSVVRTQLLLFLIS